MGCKSILDNHLPVSIFAVISLCKIGGNTLPAPNLSPCSPWILSKVTIAFNKIQVDGTDRFIYGGIVAVVDNGASHAAEYRFDHV